MLNCVYREREEEMRRLREVSLQQDQQSRKALQEFKVQVDKNSTKMFDDMKKQVRGTLGTARGTVEYPKLFLALPVVLKSILNYFCIL